MHLPGGADARTAIKDVPSISGKVGLRRTTRRRDRSGIKGCLARPPEGAESPNQSSPCRRRAHRQVRAPGTLPAQQTKKAACQSLPINSAHVQNLMCSGNVIVFFQMSSGNNCAARTHPVTRAPRHWLRSSHTVRLPIWDRGRSYIAQLHEA